MFIIGDIIARYSRRYRQFTISAFLRVVASPSLRSGSAETKINQDFEGIFEVKEKTRSLKRKFCLPKANINLKNLLTNLFCRPSGDSKAII